MHPTTTPATLWHWLAQPRRLKQEAPGWRQEQEGHRLVLVAPLRLGAAEARALKALLAELLPRSQGGLVIDLRGARRFEAAGVAACAEAVGIAEEAGVAVAFRTVPGRLRRALWLAGAAGR